MSHQRRGKACVACASIKIKCQLGSDTSLQPPCERCVRLNKECVLSVPKRQKDRVIELEAQVASLTRLLKAHGIDHPDISASNLDQNAGLPQESPEASALKKRKFDGPISAEDRLRSSSPAPDSPLPSPATNPENAEVSWLDQIVSRKQQEHVLNKYVNDLVPAFPLVPPTGDFSLDGLRRERPLLLQAIIYAAGSSYIAFNKQEQIAKYLLDHLATSALSRGDKSIELIQSIQIACLWYRTPKHHRHVAVYQLIQLTAGLAMDIGLGGPMYPSMSASDGCADGPDLESLECRRAGLVCYTLSTAMAGFMRRENGVPWTNHLDHCLTALPTTPAALPSDAWLAHFIRAERLLKCIADTLQFSDLYTQLEISDASMQSKVQTCRNHILNWKVSVPYSLRTPLIMFYEHLATASMHEPLLHTATNKFSFAAPYVSERLTPTDFPTPNVTQDHITAAFEITSAAHAMIDIYTTLDTTTIVSMPGLLTTSRVAYANYLLANLYIATTMPGNTLSAIIDPAMLCFEEYNAKLVEAHERVSAVDGRCSPARILSSASRMQEWYDRYNDSLYTSNGLLDPAENFQYVGETPALTYSWASSTPKAAAWENLFQFSDSAADFGLDILFAEPFPGPLLFDETVSDMPAPNLDVTSPLTLF